MNVLRITIALLSLNFSFYNAVAQSLTDDMAFLSDQLVQSDRPVKYRFEKQETNEIKMGVQVFFLLYKNLLSSQDNQNCSFSPSCSTYCLHAIQKRGVIRGVMSSFDRLSRCNYLSPENYDVNLETGRLIDPVQE